MKAIVRLVTIAASLCVVGFIVFMERAILRIGDGSQNIDQAFFLSLLGLTFGFAAGALLGVFGWNGDKKR